MKVVVASANPAKIRAVEQALQQIWPEQHINCSGQRTESGVAAQPMTSAPIAPIEYVLRALEVVGEEVWVAVMDVAADVAHIAHISRAGLITRHERPSITPPAFTDQHIVTQPSSDEICVYALATGEEQRFDVGAHNPHPHRAAEASVYKGAPVPPAPERLRMVVSRTRPAREATEVAERIGAELVPMGSAGAKAMAIVMDNEGIALSRRRITLSTSGVVPMMARAGAVMLASSAMARVLGWAL